MDHSNYIRHTLPPPSTPPPVAPPSPTAEWPCGLCTFLNPPSEKRCKLCLTARPRPSMRNSKSADSARNNRNGVKPPLPPRHGFSLDSKPPSPSKLKDRRNKRKRPQHHSGGNHRQGNHHGGNHLRVMSHVNHLAVSTGSLFPENVSFDPSRPLNEQSVFDRWMTAQMERARGEQPAICASNGVFLRNLQRVRAPTTQRSLQSKIDLQFHPQTPAAGDWSDDEEEDPVDPQSPSDEEEDALNWDSAPRPRHAKNAQTLTSLKFNPNHHASKSVVADARFHRQNVVPYQLSPVRGSRPQRPKLPLLPRTVSNDDMGSLARWQNALVERRRDTQTVADLWFAAQSQLRAGKNPSILAMYNISLSNIRQHNPRFRDYQRRRSQHEKAATYLQVTGDKLQRNTMRGVTLRKEIDYDDDDYSDTEPSDEIEQDADDEQFGRGHYQQQEYHQQEYHQQKYHQQQYYQQQHHQDQQQQHYDNGQSVQRNGGNEQNGGHLYSAYNGFGGGQY